MSKALTSAKLSQSGKREKKPLDWDAFGRCGSSIQVLHIDLWYADGTQGEINVTSPHIIWGCHMREYIKSQHVRLGIVKYHTHCYHNMNGVLKKSFSWFPFDLSTNTQIVE